LVNNYIIQLKTTQKKKPIFAIASLFITLNIGSKGNKNLAELLGYPKDPKFLYILANDTGLSHLVNNASIKHSTIVKLLPAVSGCHVPGRSKLQHL
jgi:hypothetical protein